MFSEKCKELRPLARQNPGRNDGHLVGRGCRPLDSGRDLSRGQLEVTYLPLYGVVFAAPRTRPHAKFLDRVNPPPKPPTAGLGAPQLLGPNATLDGNGNAWIMPLSGHLRDYSITAIGCPFET